MSVINWILDIFKNVKITCFIAALTITSVVNSPFIIEVSTFKLFG